MTDRRGAVATPANQSSTAPASSGRAGSTSSASSPGSSAHPHATTSPPASHSAVGHSASRPVCWPRCQAKSPTCHRLDGVQIRRANPCIARRSAGSAYGRVLTSVIA
ncbi:MULTISPECIES: hypothetical protein [Actinosynnema]|uniref:hypothetical protein n=1 Tax=Actinosynnema TaxID=40566 RepID=UPI0020A3C10F|nr:hypothetical protein [Actinosynnema pretiosum]